MNKGEQFLSPDEVASLFGIPVRTVYSWLHRGIGPRSYKIGRHRRFRTSDLEDWLQERARERIGA